MRTEFALFLLAPFFGCNTGDTDTRKPGETGETGETGEPLDETPLEVAINEVGPDGSTWPLAGVTVAIDDAAGQRIEAVTEADGPLVVEVDWADGPFAVTVAPAGDELGLITWMGVTVEKAVLTASYPADAEQVEVTGTVTGHTEGSYLLVMGVGATAGYYQSDSKADSYALDVATNAPFALIGVDFTYETFGPADFTQTFSGWTLLESDGVSADTTLDLDLAGTVSPHTTAGAFSLPTDLEDPLQDFTWGRTYFVCRMGTSVGTVGWETMLHPDSDGIFSFEGEYLQPTVCGGIYTIMYAVRTTTPACSSTRVVEGTPDTWTEMPTLMPTPALLSVDMPSAEDPWRLEFEPEELPDGAGWSATFTQRGDAAVWTIVGIPEAEVTLPRLPSNVDPGEWYEKFRRVTPAIAIERGGFFDAVSYGPKVGVQ